MLLTNSDDSFQSGGINNNTRKHAKIYNKQS